MLAAQALISLVQSNHTNQNKVVEESGMEMLSELIESIVTPPTTTTTNAAAVPTMPRDGDGVLESLLVGGPTGSFQGSYSSFSSITLGITAARGSTSGARASLGGGGGEGTPPRVEVLRSSLLLLGELVEFNDTNQQAARYRGAAEGVLGCRSRLPGTEELQRKEEVLACRGVV